MPGPEDQLRNRVIELMECDEDVMRAVRDAARRKRRHWLANLVSDACTFLFGRFIGDLVDRAIDWIIDTYW